MVFQALRLGFTFNASRLQNDAKRDEFLGLDSLMRRLRLAREGLLNFPKR